MNFKQAVFFLPIVLSFGAKITLEKDRVYFKKAECIVPSNKTVINWYCKIKAYSRNHVTFEVGGDLIRQYNKGLIDVELEYRPLFGTYRHVGGVKKFDGCEFLRKAKPGTPLMHVFNVFKNLTKGFVHQCPYEPGRYDFVNYTTSIQFYPLMFKGDYKLRIFARDEELDPEGGTLKVWFTLLVRGGDLF